MTEPSPDLYWARDFVGRTLTSHPIVVHTSRDGFWCETCRVRVSDPGLHYALMLREASDRPTATKRPGRPVLDPRESSVRWTGEAS